MQLRCDVSISGVTRMKALRPIHSTPEVRQVQVGDLKSLQMYVLRRVRKATDKRTANEEVARDVVHC
ncbi:hypothetical protein FVE85_8558 [Porphyridium purpureum]|uniref:Uncharacterized protein n=1 Tax=Porphyridium purpureum TaxID=35688 RepID=A0A5J4YQQ4_PORPP|nr:hypothetical protein FVE85_8558 [Porphyridium purpureum]|eukprot:POR9099..scf296_7